MRKMTIGICDDEKIFINILKNMVIECLNKRQIEGQIKTFESGKELVESSFELDVIFLDIEMPEFDGIEIGKIIQQKNSNCKIIMATCRTDRFKEAFQINAFRFMTKPFEFDELEEIINAVQATRIGTDVIELYNNRNLFKIKQKEIQYIKTYDSYSEFVTKSKIFRRDIALCQLEKILDNRMFFRIHRKIIINMLWVQKYDREYIIINNVEMAVARRKKKKFEQAYMEFDVTYR
ncbi:LytR/AlgR family response regulator transcription factor [Anaerosacchariphilus polymeriproducens]|uniref:Stage 0 sporulation protein A homolog n=1 Tax=Anaerosacchariphilus polymeriproducens TaxID=1812858 RepID=A0A371AWA3_9FIRM|nr:LytTR family DNA-binding domain-containing protein [Anaerosacchariphilus polymeriproducens]RDU23858.1 DNA-binding response regulator [Anaerosacchariphilus polymeriproducens]